MISYWFLLYHTLKIVGINSVLFFFIVLFGLYGYSVPISVFFEMDIGWHRVAKLATWEKVDDTLISFLISNQLALLAIAVVSLIFVKRSIMAIPSPSDSSSKLSYYKFAVLAGILASLSEGLNFVRAGGISAISQGKAFYQGAVNDLVLNIPYEGFFYISVALFAQFFSSVSGKIKYVTYLPVYILSIFFVLVINMAIVERGTLVVGMVVFVLGYTLNKRITGVALRYILALGVIYVFFNILTLLREKSVEYKGFVAFFESYSEKLLRVMNPANTEFGAPALNYRIYMDKKDEDYQYKWGKTYLELPLAFIPTYIYHNKPKGIVYEFRDTYFPERKKMGSTAGNGFSSLMEAFMNFSYAGPFIVYFFTIFFLIYIESKRGKSNMFLNLFYLLMFNIFLIFSRSASQYILFNLVLYIFQIAAVVIVYKLIPKKVFKKISFENEKA